MMEISHYEWQVSDEACANEEWCIPVESPPHFILHFDMNKTLIASDREGQKTAHDVICAEIANQVVDRWDQSLSVPITYTDYVKRHLLPNPHNSQEIKFQQRDQLSKVLQVLKERNHPDASTMNEKYARALGLLENQDRQVFPSFYKLIAFLQKEKIPYTLVIRTFGSEASEIAEELNTHFGQDFLTDFRTLKQGHLEGAEDNLYGLVANTDHHLVIRDDWSWWFEHGQHWEYGKPFPVEVNDPKHISLFFDDNAQVDPLSPEENIVSPYDPSTGKAIAPEELIQQGRLLPVDMLEALCDDDYYIRFVQRSLK